MDADPGLVGLEVLRCKEAHIVGRDQGHPFRSRQRGGRRHQRLFALATDAGDFEIEAITQEFPPRREVTHRLRATARRQRPPHITLRTAGQRDQTFQARRAQPGPIDLRHPALLALEIGPRHEPVEVQVARLIKAQQGDPRRHRTLAALGDQQVDTDDRFHALRHRLAVELHHREEVVLVGDGDRRHPRGDHGRRKLRDAHHAVDQRVLGVEAEVDESGHDEWNLTGLKLMRCTGEGPCARNAARCRAVG